MEEMTVVEQLERINDLLGSLSNSLSEMTDEEVEALDERAGEEASRIQGMSGHLRLLLNRQ